MLSKSTTDAQNIDKKRLDNASFRRFNSIYIMKALSGRESAGIFVPVNLNIEGNLSYRQIKELNPKSLVDLNTDHLPQDIEESFTYALQKVMDKSLAKNFKLDPRFEAEIYSKKLLENPRASFKLV